MLNRNLDFGPVVPINQIIINSMSDFPPAVAGVITLQTDVKYLIGNTGLTTSDRFEATGDVFIAGLQQLGGVHITYTGSGALFTITDGTLEVSDLRLDCPTGEVFVVNNVTQKAVFKIFSMNQVFIDSCAKLATVTDVIVNWSNNGGLVFGDGLTLTATSAPNNASSIRQFGFNAMLDGAVGIDLTTSTLDTFELENVIFRQFAGSGTGISGLASSGNILAGSFATITACEFLGSITPLVGLTTDDIRVLYSDNANLMDTSIVGLHAISSNATETVIVTQGVDVPVVGNWTLVKNSQISAGPLGTSRMTYDGERTLQFAIDVSMTFLAAAASPLLEIQLYKNGVAIANATSKVETDTISNQNVALPWLEELDSADFLEVHVANLDGTENVIMTDGIIRMQAT